MATEKFAPPTSYSEEKLGIFTTPGKERRWEVRFQRSFWDFWEAAEIWKEMNRRSVTASASLHRVLPNQKKIYSGSQKLWNEV